MLCGVKIFSFSINGFVRVRKESLYQVIHFNAVSRCRPRSNEQRSLKEVNKCLCVSRRVDKNTKSSVVRLKFRGNFIKNVLMKFLSTSQSVNAPTFIYLYIAISVKLDRNYGNPRSVSRLSRVRYHCRFSL
jgi:hypothetical protein